MCAGALLESDVDGLVFALADPERGAAGSTSDALRRRVRVVSGIMQAEAAELASPVAARR
jgi:tRNA(Arg) A34 adenosine deaminase TadA